MLLLLVLSLSIAVILNKCWRLKRCSQTFSWCFKAHPLSVVVFGTTIVASFDANIIAVVHN